jgi:hypothetical protein
VPTLKEILCAPENRSSVIRDAVQLVDSEVSAKSGISGLAIKAGYKAVKAIKPALITEAIDSMLDRFIERLEPFHDQWNSAQKSPAFDAFLAQRSKEVANALLGVTDDRARSIQNNTIKKTYEALRPQGEKNVIAAVPGLGRVLSRYVK